MWSGNNHRESVHSQIPAASISSKYSLAVASLAGSKRLQGERIDRGLYFVDEPVLGLPSGYSYRQCSWTCTECAALWCPPWGCNPSRYPLERAPRVMVVWARLMVVQHLCSLVFVLNAPGWWRGCERKVYSGEWNSCCGWTITIGPSLMGVANNLNDVIQMKCIYLDPVWCMMRLTIGFVEQSLVDYRGASGEAFWLLAGKRSDWFRVRIRQWTLSPKLYSLRGSFKLCKVVT